MTATRHDHRAETSAPPSAVWSLYADPASWPRWNGAVAHLEIDGPFRTGAEGRLTPPDGEELPFRILSAVEDESYCSETQIAETVALRATARLTPRADGGTIIDACSELVGPAAPYFAESFGPALAAGVPRGAEAIARAAEEDVASTGRVAS